MKIVIENIIRFVLLVLVQVFILDNIQFLGYITPMIYILFVLTLPIHLSRNLTLLLAFLLGLVIDMFSNTMGIHTFTSVFIAFLRTPILRRLVEVQDLVNITPNFRTIGFVPNLKYLTILILIHQIILFSIEAFSLYSIYMLIGKVVLNSLTTLLLSFGIQFFYLKRTKVKSKSSQI